MSEEAENWASSLLGAAAGELLRGMGMALVTAHALSRVAEEPLRPRVKEWPPTLQPIADLSRDLLSGFVESMAGSAARDDYTQIWYQQAVFSWSVLECLVEDLTVGALHRDPTRLGDSKARLPLHVLMLDRDDQLRAAAAVMQQADRSQGGSPRQGLDALQRPLKLVGFEVEAVERTTEVALLKLHLLRNLVAHRQGRVDAQFTRRWPADSSELGRGSAIAVKPELVVEIADGVVAYLIALQERVAEKASGD